MSRPSAASWGCAVALLSLLIVACDIDKPRNLPRESASPTRAQPITIEQPAATPTLTVLSLTPTEIPPQRQTALPTLHPATPTPRPKPASWYTAGTVALAVVGDHQRANLYAVDAAGSTWLILPDVGHQVRASPDGRWLAFVRSHNDGGSTLELYDAQSGAQRKLVPDTNSGLFRFAFDRNGQRVAYLELGPLMDGVVSWTLTAVDLVTGAAARYEAEMTGSDVKLLPGAPVGWSGLEPTRDELIIDTFLPYTEGGWMGVWGVTLPDDGSSVRLESLPLRELVPGAPAYSSAMYLAPDGRHLAFLGRDPDYFPDNFFPEFYDLAVNRLAVASLADGARTTLVDAVDGSALARAVAWSPTGERILFAKGRYGGESFDQVALNSVDMVGTTVEYGPIALPQPGGLLDLAWCDPSWALYVTWDGTDGTQHLFRYILSSRESEEIASGTRLSIVGCAPHS